jgi:hypothetical protein
MILLWNSNGPSSTPFGTPSCGNEPGMKVYSPGRRIAGFTPSANLQSSGTCLM